MDSQQNIYAISKHKFNNFAGYLSAMTIEHHNLPEIFLNKETINIVNNAPKVTFNMSANPLEPNVYRTSFEIEVKYEIECTDAKTTEPKNYHIYDLKMTYVAFTNIENGDAIDDTERKKILLVDVPYLVFPTIRHLIASTTESMKSMPVQINPINFMELFLKQNNEENN